MFFRQRYNFFLTSLFIIASVLSSPVYASMIPRPPQLDASAWILLDAQSGDLIAEHNADDRLPPASLTKMMTAYIAAHELHAGNISLRDKVPVSVKAWKMGGSRMFIREGTKVSLADLLKGIIIQSGNDASVAVAEYIAGSEDAFADLMNQHAQRIGMRNSHFVNATGWPADNHYSTARDMALLAKAIIQDYPEHYSTYKIKEFTYNDITQSNRNLMLWKDDSVDGLKTGHTEAAGFCLVSSAKKNGMRLISVVMGTDSERARASETQKLLTYGFRFFETYKAYDEGEQLSQAKVWFGEQDTVPLSLAEDLVITIPRNSHEKLEAEMVINPEIHAPIQAGETYGQVVVRLDGELLSEKPLIAATHIEEAGFFTRLWHHIVLFFSGLFS